MKSVQSPPRSDASFEARWRQRFERFARDHSADHAVSGWSRSGLAERLTSFSRLYARYAPVRGGRVLDLGCGPGTYSRWLAARGGDVTGLDYSRPTLARAGAQQTAGHERIALVQGEAYSLPFRSGIFDAVVCVGVLQTLAQPERALDEMNRVLNANGLLVLDALNTLGVPAVHARVRAWTARESLALRRFNPFALARRLRAMGYARPRIHPIVRVPDRFQALAQLLQAGGMLSLGLSHSFFIFAFKERAVPSTPFPSK